MIKVTTASGKTHEFQSFTACTDVIEKMFPDIASAAVAVLVNGELKDLCTVLQENSSVEPIVGNTNTGREIIRRSSAHILAKAIQELFPRARLGTGNVVDQNFYYDFSLEGGTISEKNFKDIEKKIKELVTNDEKFVRKVVTKKVALELFKDEKYKTEVLSSISSDEIVVYSNGKFTDIDTGPHVPSSGYLRAFKITKVAGAYWDGNNNNEMLQRIYGTAWENEEALTTYLTRIEEAEKRDHRKIAKDLGLFHIQDEAVGQVFWHDKGWSLFRTIEEYVRKKIVEGGYSEIKTPILVDKTLWEKSGHWEKFRENMFLVSEEKKCLAIKPMNCPCHVQVFKSQIRSYKDLPLRMAEFGTCHRNEPSGSLYGLMRVRGFTQDDAHIFCTLEQIREEVLMFYKMLVQVYHDFGFDNIKVKLSDRPENRIGSDETWDLAEKSLIESMEEAGVKYTINKGEGAFYGPKLEFTLEDAIGRDWQCGTIQLDFVLPQRLGAFYVGEDGQKHHPVMIHRAILGTLERFIGILIEHYNGKFPAWLAPIQLEILTVNTSALEYAKILKEKALKSQIRVSLNCSEEGIGQKIRKSIFNKIPVIWVVGEVEAEAGLVSVRNYGSTGSCSLEADKALKTLIAYVSIS